MIQDLKPGVYDLTYSPEGTPTEEDYLLCFKGREMLLKEGEGIVLPTLGELAAACGTEVAALSEKLRFLFTVAGHEYFLYRDGIPEIPGYVVKSTRSLRAGSPKEICFAAETGYQLYGWYRDNAYCGKCGARMSEGTTERNVICPSCGNTVYPKIMPAVIVGVRNGDKILMTKYAGREYTNYALIAGFCEIGETGEDTVRREVMEEAGVKVKNITYYKSQPWGFDSDLLLGYYCDLDGDETIRMDDGELSVAEWVKRDEIPTKYEDLSLTNEMIIEFKEGRR